MLRKSLESFTNSFTDEVGEDTNEGKKYLVVNQLNVKTQKANNFERNDQIHKSINSEKSYRSDINASSLLRPPSSYIKLDISDSVSSLSNMKTPTIFRSDTETSGIPTYLMNNAKSNNSLFLPV